MERGRSVFSGYQRQANHLQLVYVLPMGTGHLILNKPLDRLPLSAIKKRLSCVRQEIYAPDRTEKKKILSLIFLQLSQPKYKNVLSVHLTFKANKCYYPIYKKIIKLTEMDG